MAGFGYFPAVACVICDSPIDALVALCVRRDEAMMLVAAARENKQTDCILTTLHGGRAIAVVLTPEGRWAACNAFLDEIFATPQEAGRRLDRLLKRGRQGCVGKVTLNTELQPDARFRPSGRALADGEQ